MTKHWATKKILRAFENKDVGYIQSLVLEQQINPNALIPGRGVSLLHLIIGHPSETFALKVTKLFLRCGGNPNVQSSDGVTPLHVAAAWGRNQILHLLLVNGGDPWLQDDEKKNAFNYAFEEREWNTVEMLHHFHQMHSAANSKHDFYPKYERSLERVVLRKGEDVYAYGPSKKSTKSMTTQTQSEVSCSPVQEKIRYFEPDMSSSLDVDFPRDSEKNIGWAKDFYQTSCEVVVHQDASEIPEEKQETYVSSIHIEPSNPSESAVPKPEQSMDVRSQLFVELREAVRRRSKLKMLREESNPAPIPTDPVNEEHDPSKDSFVAKEVSYLYGVNLEENGMLRNMSDFATKVMKEIEVTETDRASDKTIDLCISSPDLTAAYLSCEEEASRRKSDIHSIQNVQTFLIPQCSSDTSNVYLTPFNSEIARDDGKENSNESFMSVAEEYKYTDAEEGVVLLEKKLVVTPTISFDEAATEDASSEDETASSSSSGVSTVPSSLSINSDVLRCELNGFGYHPGPITKTTKKLYLRKLWRFKKEALKTTVPEKTLLTRFRSPFLESTLTDVELFEEIPTFQTLEDEMTRSFECWTKRKWREGTNKTSFNYLLLDPRVSLNLPKRAAGMTSHEAWVAFLSGIFYVGKGKRSRPYDHLYKATHFWEKRSTVPPDEKTERIVEIWKEGLGVVCLQVFQNIIPVEALTREAAMIDALGLFRLKNARCGEYYGAASTWSKEDKLRLGTYLLHKAMLIFLNEGERQIKPYEID